MIGNKQVTREYRWQIMNAVRDGKSRSAIMSEFNASLWELRQACKTFGIPMPPVKKTSKQNG